MNKKKSLHDRFFDKYDDIKYDIRMYYKHRIKKPIYAFLKKIYEKICEKIKDLFYKIVINPITRFIVNPIISFFKLLWKFIKFIFYPLVVIVTAIGKLLKLIWQGYKDIVNYCGEKIGIFIVVDAIYAVIYFIRDTYRQIKNGLRWLRKKQYKFTDNLIKTYITRPIWNFFYAIWLMHAKRALVFLPSQLFALYYYTLLFMFCYVVLIFVYHDLFFHMSTWDVTHLEMKPGVHLYIPKLPKALLPCVKPVAYWEFLADWNWQ